MELRRGINQMEGSPKRSLAPPPPPPSHGSQQLSSAHPHGAYTRILQVQAAATTGTPTEHMQESPATPLEGSCCHILISPYVFSLFSDPDQSTKRSHVLQYFSRLIYHKALNCIALAVGEQQQQKTRNKAGLVSWVPEADLQRRMISFSVTVSSASYDCSIIVSVVNADCVCLHGKIII